MESLENILKNRQANASEPIEIKRLKTYIEKKYDFLPEISLSPRRITIYAPSPAQASLLRLDWGNLCRLSGNLRKIYISLKRS